MNNAITHLYPHPLFTHTLDRPPYYHISILLTVTAHSCVLAFRSHMAETTQDSLNLLVLHVGIHNQQPDRRCQNSTDRPCLSSCRIVDDFKNVCQLQCLLHVSAHVLIIWQIPVKNDSKVHKTHESAFCRTHKRNHMMSQQLQFCFPFTSKQKVHDIQGQCADSQASTAIVYLQFDMRRLWYWLKKGTTVDRG